MRQRWFARKRSARGSVDPGTQGEKNNIVMNRKIVVRAVCSSAVVIGIIAGHVSARDIQEDLAGRSVEITLRDGSLANGVVVGQDAEIITIKEAMGPVGFAEIHYRRADLLRIQEISQVSVDARPEAEGAGQVPPARKTEPEQTALPVRRAFETAVAPRMPSAKLPVSAEERKTSEIDTLNRQLDDEKLMATASGKPAGAATGDRAVYKNDVTDLVNKVSRLNSISGAGPRSGQSLKTWYSKMKPMISDFKTKHLEDSRFERPNSSMRSVIYELEAIDGVLSDAEKKTGSSGGPMPNEVYEKITDHISQALQYAQMAEYDLSK